MQQLKGSRKMSDLTERLREYDRTTAAKDMVEAADRIEMLENVLRTIISNNYLAGNLLDIARVALAPRRQENDDVFPGFRGNNDSA
jgi:hypothetical protein